MKNYKFENGEAIVIVTATDKKEAKRKVRNLNRKELNFVREWEI